MLSDKRIKGDIEDLDRSVSLDTLKTIKPVSFVYKYDDADSKKHFGFIAQDVQALFPELVEKNPDGLLTVNYTEFIPIVTSLLKSFAKVVDDRFESVEKDIKHLVEQQKSDFDNLSKTIELCASSETVNHALDDLTKRISKHVSKNSEQFNKVFEDLDTLDESLKNLADTYGDELNKLKGFDLESKCKDLCEKTCEELCNSVCNDLCNDLCTKVSRDVCNEVCDDFFKKYKRNVNEFENDVNLVINDLVKKVDESINVDVKDLRKKLDECCECVNSLLEVDLHDIQERLDKLSKVEPKNDLTEELLRNIEQDNKNITENLSKLLKMFHME